MLFSSLTFLYFFLPVVLALYFLVPQPGGSPRLRNCLLLAASAVFYAWGEPAYVFLMFGQALGAWAFGLLIERWRSRPALRQAALAGSVVLAVGALLIFKYSAFFAKNFNQLAAWLGAPPILPDADIALPIGISFYTFQILSYTIDLYRGGAAVQRNFSDFAAYVTLFPQLIAGPIVRYVDVERELLRRTHGVSDFAMGARRFVAGLGKKVLIANVLGELAAVCRDGVQGSLLSAWLGATAYALQIYFDFSGYSDMAIGLGRIFGFKFRENFNYPYMAASITDFWRRWHISLSSWFRDYVYIPLGGSRVFPPRHILNIAAVWLLTGLWHGAGWNFIVWGLYFAALLLAEKYVLGRFLRRAPPAASHAYVLLAVLTSWVLFDSGSMAESASRLAAMFGAGSVPVADADSLYYLRSYAVPLVAAGLGCTRLPAAALAALEKKNPNSPLLAVAEPLWTAALLLLATAYLVDGSFNPFIYFRF